MVVLRTASFIRVFGLAPLVASSWRTSPRLHRTLCFLRTLLISVDCNGRFLALPALAVVLAAFAVLRAARDLGEKFRDGHRLHAGSRAELRRLVLTWQERVKRDEVRSHSEEGCQEQVEGEFESGWRRAYGSNLRRE